MATFPPSYNQYAAYDPVRRSSQPISPRVHGHGHGSLDRATLYTQYGGHLDTRHDPTSYRSCILPTPIHETDTDSNHGRRRIQVACARCRKRKIKCSGDPHNGTGCQACRSSGIDAALCTFERVGTTLNFSVDTNVAESPTTPTTHYGSAGFLAGLPVDGGSRPLNYSHQPDSYGFEAQGPSEPQFIDERVWSVNHQSQNGYAPIGSSASFDNPYQNTMPRLSGADLAPLNVSSPNTGNVLPVPPPSVDRRLPALSFIGSSTSSELTSPTALVSGRLASLSLGLGNSVRGSIEDARYPHTLNGRQDVMLPPVTREFKNTAPTSSEQTYVYSNMNEDDLYGTCTAAVDPSSSATTVPPLDAMTSFPSTYMTGSRYATIPTSAPTISTMITSDEQSRSRYSQSFNTPQYGWNMANELPQRRTSGTIASGEDRDDGHRYQPIAMAPIAQPQHSRTSPSRRGDKGKEKAASGRHAQNSGTQS